MAIKPTIYQPQPHGHTIDQVQGLEEEFESIEQSAFGAIGRTEPPHCTIAYSGSFGAVNATDTFMGSGMSALKDNASMFYGAGNGSGGGDTTKARIKIPMAGWYYISWKFFVDGVSTVCTANVTLNGYSVTTNAIVSAQGAGGGWAGPHASDTVYLNTNDLLYFGLWQGDGGTRTVYGHWWGNRTGATVRWLCA